MPKFRKKPVVIEAIKFDGDNFRECSEFIGKENYDNTLNYPNIKTLEGTMEVSKDDWVIKGVNGEFYPCKPDIFNKTYEPAAGEPVDIGIRVQEDPPEQSNGIRFMTIVRVDRNLFQAANPKDARLMVRRQFQWALPPLMKVVDEEHVKLNPPEAPAEG